MDDMSPKEIKIDDEFIEYIHNDPETINVSNSSNNCELIFQYRKLIQNLMRSSLN